MANDAHSLASLRSIAVFSKFFDHSEARERFLGKVGSDYSVRFVNLRQHPVVNGSDEEKEIRGCEIAIVDPVGPLLFVPLLGDKVRWIHSSIAGVNWLMENEQFQEYIRGRGEDGPVLTRTSFTKSMVTYCIGHICAHEHHFDTHREHQKKHIWMRNLKRLPIESKTAGILGVGDVGSGIAAACKNFGMRTIGYSSSTMEKKNFDQIYPGNLDAVLTQSDYVINSLPSSRETTHLLSNERFKCASKSPVFINVGRGSVIDDSSVIQALDNGWISKAILDVCETEPLPGDSPLWDHPKITVTPHVSGAYLPQDNHREVIEAFARNLDLIRKGELPKMIVNYNKGY